MQINCHLSLQSRDDSGSDFLHVHGRLKSRDDLNLAVNEEFREVPADIGLVTVFLVVHGGKLFQRGVFQALAKALKRFFCLITASVNVPAYDTPTCRMRG